MIASECLRVLPLQTGYRQWKRDYNAVWWTVTSFTICAHHLYSGKEKVFSFFFFFFLDGALGGKEKITLCATACPIPAVVYKSALKPAPLLWKEPLLWNSPHRMAFCTTFTKKRCQKHRDFGFWTRTFHTNQPLRSACPPLCFRGLVER